MLTCCFEDWMFSVMNLMISRSVVVVVKRCCVLFHVDVVDLYWKCLYALYCLVLDECVVFSVV